VHILVNKDEYKWSVLMMFSLLISEHARTVQCNCHFIDRCH